MAEGEDIQPLLVDNSAEMVNFEILHELALVKFVYSTGYSLQKAEAYAALRKIILYTIALADYDQENLEVCKDVINTKSGINHLALYHSFIGSMGIEGQVGENFEDDVKMVTFSDANRFLK